MKDILDGEKITKVYIKTYIQKNNVISNVDKVIFANYNILKNKEHEIKKAIFDDIIVIEY